MQGNREIVELLNEVLTAELTAINQYFVHAKMQANWGYTKIAEYTRSESIDEMKHAETLTDRILFLEGLPNLQKLGKLNLALTVEIVAAGRLLDIELLDHLIIGQGRWVSLKRLGLGFAKG